MSDFDPHSDEVRVIACPCCDNELRATDRNLALILQEADRRYPHGATLDIGSVPTDIDLTGPLTADDVARVASAMNPQPAPRSVRRRKARRRRP